MSLNNIELNPKLLADLYRNSLVDSEQKTPSPILVEGQNLKSVSVVVASSGSPYLPGSERTFLTSVLSACKLTMADIALFHFDLLKEEKDLLPIQEGNQKVLLFGVDPLSIGLPMNFPFFQLQQFDNRIYLYAPSLKELAHDKTLKTKLWTCLKSLFGI